MAKYEVTFRQTEEHEVTLNGLTIDSSLCLSMKLEAFGDYQSISLSLEETIISYIRSRKIRREIEDMVDTLNMLLSETDKVKANFLPECFEAPVEMP